MQLVTPWHPHVTPLHLLEETVASLQIDLMQRHFLLGTLIAVQPSSLHSEPPSTWQKCPATAQMKPVGMTHHQDDVLWRD